MILTYIDILALLSMNQQETNQENQFFLPQATQPPESSRLLPQSRGHRIMSTWTFSPPDPPGSIKKEQMITVIFINQGLSI